MMLSRLKRVRVRVRVRVISPSNKSAGYEREVYTVSGISTKVDVHSTFTPGSLL